MSGSGDSIHPAAMMDSSKTCCVPGSVPWLSRPLLRSLTRLTQAPKRFAFMSGAMQAKHSWWGHGDAGGRHLVDVTRLPHVARIAERDAWRPLPESSFDGARRMHWLAIDQPQKFATPVWRLLTGPIQTIATAPAVTTFFAPWGDPLARYASWCTGTQDQRTRSWKRQSGRAMTDWLDILCLTFPVNRQQRGAVQSGRLAASVSPDLGFLTVRCNDNVSFGAMHAGIRGASVVAGIELAALLRDKLVH